MDLIGVPKGIRTPVTAVKGRCPRPLDDGDADEALNKVTTLPPKQDAVHPAVITRYERGARTAKPAREKAPRASEASGVTRV
jgi:hypothetical protein